MADYCILVLPSGSTFLMLNVYRLYLAFCCLLSLSSCSDDYNYISINPHKDQIFSYPYVDVDTFGVSGFNEVGKQYFLCKVFGVLYHFNITDTVSSTHICEKLQSYIQDIRLKDKVEFNTLLLSFILECSDRNKIRNSLKGTPSIPGFLNTYWLTDSVYLTPEVKSYVRAIQSTYFAGNYGTKVLSQSNIGVPHYKLSYENDLKEVSQTMRMIGLYHYWNLINYHYVNHFLISNNWDSVLFSSIETFENARTKLSYQKAVLELIAKIDDSHSRASADVLDDVFGVYVPNFRMLKINDTFIVHKNRSDRLSRNVRSGDIIVSIDGIGVHKLNDSLIKFVGGSNEFSRQRELNKYILCRRTPLHKLEIIRGNRKSIITDTFYNYNKISELEIDDNQRLEKKVVVRWLQDSIAYLHISKLFADNVEENINAAIRSRGLIIDFRGYPNDSKTVSSLLSIIPSNNDTCVAYIYSDINKPSFRRYLKAIPPYKWRPRKLQYNRTIALLVDDNTQSQAEFVVMALQRGHNVLTIGSTTAGADGNITEFVFPGNLTVFFSGIGVLYPDLTITQRTGVKINIPVRYSTLAIKKGIDPLIENATHHLIKRFHETNN